MSFVDELLNKAKAANKTIVLCEGEDKRVVEAAAKIVKDGIAKIILLGTEEEIKAAAPGADLTGVKIVDPATSADADRYAEILFKAREGKINKKTNQPEYADSTPTWRPQRLTSKKTARCSERLSLRPATRTALCRAPATQRPTPCAPACR